MSAFLKASAYALQDQPVVNAVIEGQEIIYRDYVDISVAVATPKGLVVPVIRNVERMNYADIERTMAQLGEKARKGQIAVEDMDGGTFTISNGGVFSSLMGTPIINPPQSSILGMHAIFERPMAIKGQRSVAQHETSNFCRITSTKMKLVKIRSEAKKHHGQTDKFRKGQYQHGDGAFHGKNEKDRKIWLFITRVPDDVDDGNIKSYIETRTDTNDVQVKKLPTYNANLDNQSYHKGQVIIYHEGVQTIYNPKFWPRKIVVIRPMMYVALTYDHRLIDGREAVLFLRKIKQCVEDPRAILAGL
ncbi:hypothetical protein NQ314_020359 [Rhamnusium bicolor]|uniref:Dihydrolipoyllysine-residue succinyltransferase component of 2-oxoglutarate dehydrogenase complex, mitochondrial n=1 Tax=Rhamnusium bicolor TaxID=1586634 RepID=A0AAV8WNC6_9CUCU|nr:hypothetical protein NQ314_020359 [Rhamnusium bicolor]